MESAGADRVMTPDMDHVGTGLKISTDTKPNGIPDKMPITILMENACHMEIADLLT